MIDITEITLDEFLIGTILGDASIPKLGKGFKNYRWTCGHSEVQLPYLQWKVNFLVFNNLHTGNIYKYIDNNKRYKQPVTSYYTKSKTNPIFEKYRKLFYGDNHRIFPKIKLTPNILSIYYMDDGHLLRLKSGSSKAIFNMHRYSNEDREYFCKLLFNTFNIKATARHKNFEVAVSTKSMTDFKNIVNIHSMFSYKI